MKLSAPMLFALFFVSFIYESHSQHFVWAAGSDNVDIRYQFSSIDPLNNLVVGGDATTNWTHHGMPQLFDGNGNPINLHCYRQSYIIACYDSKGNLKWHKMFDKQYSELQGICHDKKGNIVLLVQIKGTTVYSGKDSMGYFVENGSRNEMELPDGLNLVYLNMYGNFQSSTHLFPEGATDFSVSEFQKYVNGGFIITGFAKEGKLCNKLNTTAGAGGGDFVLVIDSLGQANWAEVVSYSTNSCCSYFTIMCKATYSNDGTIYLAGTYYKGGTFGGNKTITSPKSEKDNQYNPPFESYISSYSKKGKLNWVHTSINKSMFHSVLALPGNEGVVMSVKLFDTNKYYGITADTSGAKNNLFLCYDQKGILKWQNTHRIDQIHQIKMDYKEHLYFLGTNNEIGKTALYGIPGVIGNDTLANRTSLFIANFNASGTYQWVKEAEMPITTSNDPILFDIDGCGNFYITGNLFFSFKAQLSIFDKAFLKGSVYGPACFVSRFKNTVPVAIIKPHDSTSPDSLKQEPLKVSAGESCILSPGPWRLRNYPNPFIISTTFEFKTTYKDYLSLDIFSFNGEKVATVFASRLTEPGKYTEVFETNLPAGAYIARLTGTETVASCRIILEAH